MNFVIAILMTMAVVTELRAGEAVTYEAGGKTCEGYYTSPATNAPLVLIAHDWDGLTDYEVKRADMLHELGYAAFAVDLFGKGVRPKKLKEKRRLTGALYKDRAKMLELLNDGIKAAREQGANVDRAVAIGYCFGGTAVLELARSGAELDGFVTFHGGLETPEGQDYSKVKSSVLALHGTADQHVPMEAFAALAKELEAANVPHEMITYGGARHAFTVPGSDRYNADADSKSWQRFKMYLTETLK